MTGRSENVTIQLKINGEITIETNVSPAQLKEHGGAEGLTAHFGQYFRVLLEALLEAESGKEIVIKKAREKFTLFLEECCPESTHPDYTKWCEENGIEPLELEAFAGGTTPYEIDRNSPYARFLHIVKQGMKTGMSLYKRGAQGRPNISDFTSECFIISKGKRTIDPKKYKSPAFKSEGRDVPRTRETIYIP